MFFFRKIPKEKAIDGSPSNSISCQVDSPETGLRVARSSRGDHC